MQCDGNQNKSSKNDFIYNLLFVYIPRILWTDMKTMVSVTNMCMHQVGGQTYDKCELQSCVRYAHAYRLVMLRHFVRLLIPHIQVAIN